MNLTEKFYRVLFNEDEWTCFAPNKYGTATYPAIAKGLKEEFELFSINPMEPRSTRANDSVIALRNILVEIDKDPITGKIISGEQQKEWFDKIHLPWSTLLWSGNKSYHAIISVEEGFDTPEEYRGAIDAVYRVLERHNIPNDTSVKDLGRLCRAAGALRWDTKQLQEVERVRRRITRAELEKWLKFHDEEIIVKEPRKKIDYIIGTNDWASTERKFDTAKKWTIQSFGSFSPQQATGAHVWLFKFAINCYKVDLNLYDAISSAIQQWGTTYHSSQGELMMEKVIKAGWEFAHKEDVQQYKI